MNNDKSLLIIDDDSTNIFALSAILKAKKFHCLAAASAAEGFDLLKKEDHNIGIVLMDMMMPEMDGYEAMAAMREDREMSAIPVIAVTAQAMDGDKQKCMESGASGYVSKPIDIDELIRLINRLK